MFLPIVLICQRRRIFFIGEKLNLWGGGSGVFFLNHFFFFFFRIISNCIHLLVQDLESGCDAALTVMNKVSFFCCGFVCLNPSFMNVLCVLICVDRTSDNLLSIRLISG